MRIRYSDLLRAGLSEVPNSVGQEIALLSTRPDWVWVKAAARAVSTMVPSQERKAAAWL